MQKTKMSKIPEKLNYKDLYNELQSAIEEDKNYWVKNDAKLRAVVTSKTYDEFRDIVAAAHLTPVSKQDWKKRAYTWNTVARKYSNETE